MIQLVHTSDDDPGIRRKGAGTGFFYLDVNGEKVGDPELLRRIQELAIPPAYEDVWICPIDNGHLQATGLDSRTRKQYRYHPVWHEIKRLEKFDRLIEVGEGLPRLRRKIRKILKSPANDREMVTAAAVRIIDRFGFRPGNETYLNENGTRGVSTLSVDSVKIGDDTNRIALSYVAKGGREVKTRFSDHLLARILEDCHELPGQRLFTYEVGGDLCTLDSGQINDFLRDIFESEVTAKDLRTWRASVAAVDFLMKIATPDDREAEIRSSIRSAADSIRNRFETCRKHYVHPEIADTYRESGRFGFSRLRPRSISGLQKPEVQLLQILKHL